ncbi:2-polyprenyl-6-methoxyphenol hydroxylase-like FAD-dependent oxidoreductase [Arthrobacter ulcerisalmonis]|nr:hypothetical protein [Arthrobacter ulcerisalmonis]MDQ0663157.1 2-polyprenyl-6-methoxyphenol hydroxylase-like FAD-dependent oxidoreductase [Arthrobacter ulcerisalmonis]
MQPGPQGGAERVALAALDDVPAGRVRVRSGTRVSRMTANDGGARAAVAGSPGKVLAADLLIGADGIDSQVARQILRSIAK